MVIDESKINEMISQEIKQQVTNKMKQVGRQAILDQYKDVIAREVQNHLEEIKKETVNEIKLMVGVDKDYFKKEVVEMIKEVFSNRIEYVLTNNEQDYY